MLHDWLYAVEAFNHSGKILDFLELERRLRAIAVDAMRRLANGEAAPPVGMLSADDRDQWATVSVSCPPVDRKFM